MNHLDIVRARQASEGFLQGAQKRADVVTERMKASNMNTLGLLLQEAKGYKDKAIWLKELTNALDKCVSGVAPCKVGCSHCCNMATLITVEEAQALSKASGRALVMPAAGYINQDQQTAVSRFDGVPCPFLVDSKCSVYQSRPHACRVHYSMDADNLLCKIVPGESIRTPTLDTGRFTMLAMMCYDDPLSVQYADIRDFFPPL